VPNILGVIYDLKTVRISSQHFYIVVGLLVPVRYDNAFSDNLPIIRSNSKAQMLATTTKLFFLTFKCPYNILRFNFIGVLVTSSYS